MLGQPTYSGLPVRATDKDSEEYSLCGVRRLDAALAFV